MSNQPKNAGHIGGGLGGLAAAIRLAARGWRVTLCEQGASRSGGKMNRLQEGGFTFDTGSIPHHHALGVSKICSLRRQTHRDYLSFTAMRPLAALLL